MRSISLLKSPHKMCVWFGCVAICCAMFCFISGMSLMSPVCVGIYLFIISHGCRGLFFIVIICK